MARSLFGLALRLGGVGGKFAAVTALAAVADIEEVGRFSLFFGAINVLIFAISFDFHQFALREIVSRRSAAARLRVICGQQAFNAAIYVIVAMLAIVVASLWSPMAAGLPVMWFVVILVTDHAAQELSRTFTVLAMPTQANILYTLKSGAWGWVGATLILLGNRSFRSEDFYPLWATANVAALAYGAYALRSAFRGAPISIPQKFVQWVRRGIRVSALFYVTSVSTSALSVVDRFVVASSTSISSAGMYTFWQSLCSVGPVVVYAAVGMHFLPRLMTGYRRGYLAEVQQLRVQFFRQSLLVAVIFSTLLFVAAPAIPVVLGQPNLGSSSSLAALLLFAAVMTALWQVPYQVLYSSDDDAFLAAVLLTSVLTSSATNMIVVPRYGLEGAALVSGLANLGVFAILNTRVKRVTLNQKRARRVAASSVDVSEPPRPDPP